MYRWFLLIHLKPVLHHFTSKKPLQTRTCTYILDPTELLVADSFKLHWGNFTSVNTESKVQRA